MESGCKAFIPFRNEAIFAAIGLFCLAATYLASLGGSASASTPLAQPRAISSVRGLERTQRKQLSEALRETVRGDHPQAPGAEVAVMERKLKPYFAALPKNAAGRLEHPTARYALHRFFVREKSIYMNGLEPVGDVWSASSPIASLEKRVPSEVQEQFHGHVQAMRGFDLSELAMLAATLEAFVHRDANEWLREAYKHTNLSMHESVSPTQLRSLLVIFMWVLLGKRHEGTVPLDYILEQLMPEMFPDWTAYKVYLNETQDRFLNGHSGNVTFHKVSELVDVIVDGFGGIQKQVCNYMTDMMVLKAVPGTGRITLPDFYSIDDMFSESFDTLKQLGVIASETEGSLFHAAQVIIPNYVTSAPNCITASNHFAVCCPDACEGLMTHLELHVAFPTAKPEQITQIVEALPSRTQPAPRKLPDVLLARLRGIAERHGGSVPLHGRLFKQWMHHAYPLECQFPAVAGHSFATSTVEFFKNIGSSHQVTEEQLLQLQEHKVKDLEGSDLQSTLPWVGDELIFVHEQPSLLGELRTIARALALCGAGFAMVHVFAVAALGYPSGGGGVRKPGKMGDC